jgi:hypothetical protein
MGQREAIAFGDGVATTMRLKFEKLDAALLPGAGKRDQTTADATDQDVDLALIVDRLRNVLKPQQSMTFIEQVDSARQAGDPEYRRPAATARAQQPGEDFDLRYGLKPATFGMRPQND